MPVRVKYGAKGYGMYFMIIEMLRSESSYCLECDYDSIAYELHEPAEDIKDIVENFKLFKIEDGIFYSESLLRRMKKRDEISEKRRQAALSGRDKRGDQTNVKQLPSKSPANASPKGKERKEKETKTTPLKMEWFKLVELLKFLILRNNPKANISKTYKGEWYDVIRLMIKCDNRTVEEIKNLITWSQKDTFWKTNILSMSKLRKQFDALTVKRQNSKPESSGKEYPKIGTVGRKKPKEYITEIDENGDEFYVGVKK